MVLVADDSPTIQKRAQGILKGEGFDVETVSNGVAAIKKLAKIHPLVVLADVSMPGKDGYEVCDFVKNSAEFAHVPVLLVASDLEPYDEARGARVRADGIIKKPFEPEELISKVTKLAAQAEAAAPKPEPARTVITAPPPEFAMGTVPMEEEPEVAPRQDAPPLSAFSEGIAFAEPALEEMPAAPPEAAVPEPAPPLAEPLMEAEVSPAPEPAIEVAPAPEEAPPVAEAPPIAAEPVLVEEPAPVAPEPSPEPATEQTLMFRAPAQIAEPVLSDELAAAAPVPEPTAVPFEEEPAPVAATSLDSFSLAEAATGQVRMAPPEAEVEPEVEAPAAPAVPLDPQWVYSIVRKAVAKMSPPALPPQIVEEMASKLAEEIIAELNAESPSVQ
jgi:CheY-like chemotaxis protein